MARLAKTGWHPAYVGTRPSLAVECSGRMGRALQTLPQARVAGPGRRKRPGAGACRMNGLPTRQHNREDADTRHRTQVEGRKRQWRPAAQQQQQRKDTMSRTALVAMNDDMDRAIRFARASGHTLG